MNREPIKVIADIIAQELNLDMSRIFIYNDGRELPKDKGLFVVLSIESRPPYASKSEYKMVGGKFCNVQTMNVAERIVAQVVSKDTSARLRAFEVQLAMGSDFAIKMMEKHGFHISQLSEVSDRSFLEATARLTRFDCVINILTAYEKIKPVDYYESADFNAKFNS